MRLSTKLPASELMNASGTLAVGGVLASDSCRKSSLPSPKVYPGPGAFSGQRQGCKTQRGPPSTASVYVMVVHCWEIFLGQADPWNVTFVCPVLS